MSFKSLSDIFGVNRPRKKFGPKKATTDAVLNFLDLVHSWEDIVGPRISSHTLPLKNNNNCLTILTDHPVFSQQLSFLEKEIIEKVKRKFPQLTRGVSKLRFQVNAKFFKTKFEQIQKIKPENKPIILHPRSPEYKILKKEFEELNLETEDEQTKDLLLSLFIQTKMK